MLIKCVTETIATEVKEQKGRFLGMLAATLGANLLGNMLLGRGVVRGGEGMIPAGEGVIRAVEEQNFQCRFILQLILKYKNIAKMNLSLMMFIQ